MSHWGQNHQNGWMMRNNRNSPWGTNNAHVVRQRQNQHRRNEQSQKKEDAPLKEDCFTINVGDKKYRCNKFAVNMSEVIREYRIKNPTSEEYDYNFDGSVDCFQTICDFFNFRNINITIQNMNSLRTISENLKIVSILTKINNYLSQYEEKVQKIENIEEVFNLLYHIKELTVDSVKNSIINSQWSHSKDNVIELSSFILQVVRSNYNLHSYLIDLLIELDKSSDQNSELNQLIPFISNHILNFFYQSQFYCHFAYKLTQRKILPMEKIIKKIIQIDYYFNEEQNNNNNEKKTWGGNQSKNNIGQQNNNNSKKFLSDHHNNIVNWFLPELMANKLVFRENALNSLSKKSVKMISDFMNGRIELYEKYRDTLEPIDEISKAIYNDDVDTLQSIVSKSATNINKMQIHQNIFDAIKINDSKSLINYSAECNSIKCFKYLLLNHANLDNLSMSYAIFGGNTEIIRTIDQKYKVNYHSLNKETYVYQKYGDNKYNDRYLCYDSLVLSSPIYLTIMMHKYDLFDWITDEKIKSDELSNDSLVDFAFISVLSGNVHSLIFCIDKGLVLERSIKTFACMIKFSSELGYYKIVEFIINHYNEFKLQEEKFTESSILFGSIPIYKIILENFTITSSPINFAVRYGHNDLVEYLLNNNFKSESSNQILYILNSSIENNYSNIFNTIVKKFSLDDLKNKFKVDYTGFITLCKSSCIQGNYEISCVLIDFIINNFPNSNLTNLLNHSISSGSEKLCHFLIDKKDLINFDEIIIDQKNYTQKPSIILSIYNKCDPYEKEQLSQTILYKSVQSKNKEIFEFFLPKKLNDRQILLYAVEFNDVKFVNEILLHNSSPSFINQNSKKGTALCIASRNNNLEIVNRLLSLPGIEPNLTDSKEMTAFMIAIQNLNIDIISTFVDYYGDDIQSQSWQLQRSISSLSGLYLSSKSNAKAETIKKLIFIFEGFYQINQNLSFESIDLIPLVRSCKSNDIIDMLLKFDKINVNKQNCSSGDTLLIEAINSNNIELAKSLIEFPKTDINMANYFTETALTIASQKSMIEIVDILIKHPKFDCYNSNIDLAFFLATKIEVLNLLSSVEGLDVNYQLDHLLIQKENPKNNESILFTGTSLTFSVKSNNIKKIRMILNHSSFDPLKSQIKSAIFSSINTGKEHIFKELFKVVKDANILVQKGMNLFDLLYDKQMHESLISIMKNSNLELTKNDVLKYYQHFMEESNQLLQYLVEYDSKHNHYIDLNDKSISEKLVHIVE